jgi:transposase InsO family protein
MKVDIKEHLQRCEKCARVKFPNYATTAPMGESRVSRETMEAVSVDIKGTLPKACRAVFRNIITLVDLLSRYGWVKRVPTCTTIKFIELLKEIEREQGKMPSRIYHDNGKVFVSHEFQSFLRERGIMSCPTAIYHSQANPVEHPVENLKLAKSHGVNIPSIGCTEECDRALSALCTS